LGDFRVPGPLWSWDWWVVDLSNQKTGSLSVAAVFLIEKYYISVLELL
jgi:hypothetical protein